MKWTLLCTAALMMASLRGIAQEKSSEDEAESGRNKITIAISHTHVPGGANDAGEKVWLTLPSWGLDYDFRVSKRWGLGIHTDIVIQDFEYSESDGIIKKRTKPFAIAAVGTLTATKHLTFIGGGGIEIAPEGTLTLIRLGGDYGWELPNNW